MELLETTDKILLESKKGDITGDKAKELISLYGVYSDVDSSITEYIEIVIKDGITKLEKKFTLDFCGRNFKIELIDFFGDNINNLFIIGTEGNSNFILSSIFRYIDNEFIEIFNSINLYPEYSIRSIYPVQNVLNDYYYLLIQQEETQQLITFKNNTVYVLDEWEVTSTKGIKNSTKKKSNNKNEKIEKQEKKDIRDFIPSKANIISLESFGGTEIGLLTDLDGDKNDELLCAYKYKGEIFISVFKYNNGNLKFLDSYKGQGYDINDLIIAPFRTTEINNIIIGWKLADVWAKLDILELKSNRLKRIVDTSGINYSKIELEEMKDNKDGKTAIALWTHDTGKAYKIEVYKLKKDKLKATSKYNRYYFDKVENYYQTLLEEHPNSPMYLYYLALCQYKSGKDEEALKNLDMALETENPYPSEEEIDILRTKLLRKISN